ncbi:geranyl transferase [Sporanaerobium hydrogeniformans]|uniref:Geranyl transferase n=1 Tax=Sporanaerobium hydrogeniformans TaxID=3072179 RepID=A0AC61DIM8_9FIRM|nr:farnesyl diphosphate synthase [Sporanaerobium hydrogeniformans]PHV72366.1 geranyl transferase [Sporanaerobium hydrogeniformans]
MKKTLNAYSEQMNQLMGKAICLPHGPFSELHEAMRYSLNAGGKRIRPVLMQLCYEAVGGKEEIESFLMAIEMIHTYSLIHDDLPAMDDDDLRRGKPTNHMVFGEATAILAGDALLTEAFQIMLSDALRHGGLERIRAAHILSEASGMGGMIGGQILDMASENKTIDLATLDCIQLHKTGALIAAATKMGAVLGGGGSKEIAALEAYGKYIGKVFQIVDDILDAISTAEELGKPVHSDEKNEKNTYLSFYSIEESYAIAKALTDKALKLLEQIPGDTSLLAEIAETLIKRKN